MRKTFTIVAFLVFATTIRAGEIKGTILQPDGQEIKETVQIMVFDSVGTILAKSETNDGHFNLNVPTKQISKLKQKWISILFRREGMVSYIVYLNGNTDETQIIHVLYMTPK